MPDNAVRGLAVLADGGHAAFAAGAVAALAAAGARWTVAAGAGLGAQVAALALLGEADEAARRWQRQGESGAPALESLLAAGRARLGSDDGGLLLLADAWRLGGWLAPGSRDAFLAPERADLPGRLRRAGAELLVVREDVQGGCCAWQALAGATAQTAWDALRAAASHPAGWECVAEPGGEGQSWGGVGVLAALEPPWRLRGGEWDVVCGFPVPAVARPGLGGALLDLIQRRGEISAAAAVTAWTARDKPPRRLVAPTPDAYLGWTAREGADLGVEYPLPNERNGELLASLVGFGRVVAEATLREPG